MAGHNHKRITNEVLATKIDYISRDVKEIKTEQKEIKKENKAFLSRMESTEIEVAVMKDRQKNWNVGLVVAQVIGTTVGAVFGVRNPPSV